MPIQFHAFVRAANGGLNQSAIASLSGQNRMESPVVLTAAFPLCSFAFLPMPSLAHCIFGEPLSWNAMVGGAVIVPGVAIAVR